MSQSLNRRSKTDKYFKTELSRLAEQAAGVPEQVDRLSSGGVVELRGCDPDPAWLHSTNDRAVPAKRLSACNK